MREANTAKQIQPIMLATWSFGAGALAAAWPTLLEHGALDAVEAAGRYAEDDLTNHTVGVGGWPDRDCDVSLDAAVMLSPSFRGGVGDVRAYANPVSIARRVAERTPHTLIVGQGAESFAADQGFATAPLLTEAARQRWEQWKAERDPFSKTAGRPMPNVEEYPVAHPLDRNTLHDTIGVLALDARGTLAAACTTSGLPWKLPGRVGDSPIVGHGLYCDPSVGAAVCTGHGELVSGVCGAFLAVESLRRSATPGEAARVVIERIRAAFKLTERDQVGVIVLNSTGNYGSASLRQGFKVAVRNFKRNELCDPDSIFLFDA